MFWFCLLAVCVFLTWWYCLGLCLLADLFAVFGVWYFGFFELVNVGVWVWVLIADCGFGLVVLYDLLLVWRFAVVLVLRMWLCVLILFAFVWLVMALFGFGWLVFLLCFGYYICLLCYYFALVWFCGIVCKCWFACWWVVCFSYLFLGLLVS